MKTTRKCISMLAMLATLCLAVAALGMTTTAVYADEPAFVVKAYTPTASDCYNPWSAVTDLSGGGVNLGADAGINVPLKADEIEMDIGYLLAVGDNKWFTMAFTSTPYASGDPANALGGADGFYLHVGNTAANCTKVYVKYKNGATNAEIPCTSRTPNNNEFMDNAADTAETALRLTFKMTKGADDSYTITFANGATVLKTFVFAMPADCTFANANGQTYFSTAMRNFDNDDAARYVRVYSMKSYVPNYQTEVSYPAQATYTYTGEEIAPELTVTESGTTLVKGTDYTVTYANNVEPGVATATVTFAGKYANCDQVVRKFVIAKNDGLSVKKYVPQSGDFINYWGGVSDLAEKDGGGVYTFAHASMTVPLKADDIAFTTNFRIPSNNSKEEGGDGIDGWFTISFSAAPGEAPVSGASNDNTFPYYAGAKRGLYIQVANVSKTGVPNCAWVRVFKKTTDEAFTGDEILNKFVDNVLVYKEHEVAVNFSMQRGTDGKYTIKMTDTKDDTVYMNEKLDLSGVEFFNEKGQTYFSTAIYEGGCNENEHSAHRGIAIFDANVYTIDASGAEVTLDKTSYVYEEGVAHKPVPTVKIGDKTLVNNTDYYVQYKNNRDVGTATAVVTFIGDYTGNEAVSEEFTITAPAVDPGDDDDNQGGGDNTGDTNKPDDKGCSCKSNMGASVGLAGLVLLAGAAVLAVKRRKADR